MTGSIYAVAFDYRENMVYWSQNTAETLLFLKIEQSLYVIIKDLNINNNKYSVIKSK
jgi:hypothetical protein